MSRARMEIPFPLRGLSDAPAQSDQPPLTTRSGVNVRTADPQTGRLRGARRAGMRRLNSTAMGDGTQPVQAVATLIAARDRTSYTLNTTPTTAWSKKHTNLLTATDLAVTSAGDVWSAASAQVELRTPGGDLLETLAIPVASAGEVVTGVATDLTSKALYVGTGRANAPYAGRVIRYDEDADGDWSETWRLNLDDISVADVAVRFGQLFVACHKAENAATVRCYNGLAGSQPALLYEAAAAFPINQLAVNQDGECFVACSPSAAREDAPDPAGICAVKYNSTTPSDLWTPEDVSGTLHAWFDIAEQLKDVPAGQRIDQLTDASGNARHFYRADGYPTPAAAQNAVCGLPAIRFSANAEGGLGTRLVSGPGAASAIPTNSNTRFIMAMLVRGTAQAVDQPRLIETGGKPFMALDVPRSVTFQLELSDPDAEDTGSPPRGTLLNSSRYQFGGGTAANDLPAAIVVIGIDATGGNEKSFVRFNGVEYNRFTVSEIATDDGGSSEYAPRLGFSIYGDGRFSGWLAELAVATYSSAWTLPGTPDTAGTTDWEKLEGYLAHKFGLYDLLPDGGSPFTHTYEAATGWPTGGSGEPAPSPSGDELALRSAWGMVIKLRADYGDVLWVATGSGLGLGVAVDDAGGVWSVGPAISATGPAFTDTVTGLTGAATTTAAPTEPDVRVRKIIDEGDDWSEDSGDGAWAVLRLGNYTSGTGTTFNGPTRLAVDGGGNLYVPMNITGSTQALAKYGPTGTVEWTVAINTSNDGRAVVTDGATLPTSDIDEPESVYLATATNAGETAVHRLDLVDVAVGDGPATERHVVAVCGGNVYTLADGAAPTLIASGTFDQYSRIVSLVQIGQALYGIDGQTGARITADGAGSVTVEAWTASNGGKLPARARLLARWGDLAVLAATESDPANVYLSAIGDPLDWQAIRAVPTAKDAVDLRVSDVGAVPQPVTALVPLSDERLLIGTAQGIYRLDGHPRAGLRATGDPTGQPGRLVQVSDKIGMAFGSSWTFDDNGVLYFASQHGTVMRMLPPAGPIEALDADRIRDRLSTIDLSLATRTLVWDNRLQEVRVFETPVALPEGTIPSDDDPGEPGFPSAPGDYTNAGSPGGIPDRSANSFDFSGEVTRSVLISGVAASWFRQAWDTLEWRRLDPARVTSTTVDVLVEAVIRVRQSFVSTTDPAPAYSDGFTRYAHVWFTYTAGDGWQIAYEAATSSDPRPVTTPTSRAPATPLPEMWRIDDWSADADYEPIYAEWDRFPGGLWARDVGASGTAWDMWVIESDAGTYQIDVTGTGTTTVPVTSIETSGSWPQGGGSFGTQTVNESIWTPTATTGYAVVGSVGLSFTAGSGVPS